MILLSAEKISKSFPDKVLLQKASLYLSDTDKVGVIGINGTGKTTLLNLLAGLTPPDEGTITRASGARIAYLRQNPVFDKDLSLLSIVLQNTDKQTQDESTHEAKTILTKLGFFDFDMSTGTMSEGEKKRVAIAQTLMSPCELLILDEPTNHLDSHMVQWLETFLQRFRGAIVMVTHDRYFLERVTSRIVEIDSGALYTYDGNYSQFLAQKAQREEMELATQRKSRSLYRRELEWMQRGARARSTKSKRANRALQRAAGWRDCRARGVRDGLRIFPAWQTDHRNQPCQQIFRRTKRCEGLLACAASGCAGWNHRQKRLRKIHAA